MMRFSRMTKFCRTKKLGALGALALTAMLVQACDQPATTASSTRLYAIDQAGGAKTCNSPSAQPAGGQTTDVAMTVTNDGGWCGLSVTQSGKPYSASVLTARPKNGKVYVHTVGDRPRVDYTPDRGFAGNDSFTVKLVPGDAVVRVNVAVAK